MGSGGMEFILAQVPYSMKGIILGVGYYAFSSVVAINTAIEFHLSKGFLYGALESLVVDPGLHCCT